MSLLIMYCVIVYVLLCLCYWFIDYVVIVYVWFVYHFVVVLLLAEVVPDSAQYN